VVERRRADHQRFLATDLPDAWNGDPRPIPLPATSTERAEPGVSVQGLGVSSGTATGRVRVVHEIGDLDFEVDDVLVCRTTDPSWASLMAIAAALVIDVGGAISHGAIVARELGIPCVIGTGNGTRVLRDATWSPSTGAPELCWYWGRPGRQERSPYSKTAPFPETPQMIARGAVAGQ